MSCTPRHPPGGGGLPGSACPIRELGQNPNWVASMAHLGLTVGFGAGTNGVEARSDGDFAAYDWSVGLAGGPSTFLIHDVTDEISSPIDSTSALLVLHTA